LTEENFLDNEEENKRKTIRLIGIFVTIPFVLAVPPVIGWLIGTWLDKKFGTSHILMYVFLILGFIAGIREFYRIIKTYGDRGV
jgi:ATP synthase protein I